MSRATSLAGLLSLAGAVSVAAAQERPNFSGEWVRADSAAVQVTVAATGDASFRRGDMGSGWGSPFTITQRADRLVVEYTFFSAYDLQPRLRFTYALDGSESRNAVMIGHATSEQKSKASWVGSTLVIATTYPAPSDAGGRAVTAEVRQALTLESPTLLVVETTRVGVLGGATTTTRATYIRH
ncbi:MAG TPA: hypothetical protein VJL28_02490 [Gemmatimonadaceae bacterium]|nr:hypothetical protein [Gemmatimonadaceae bacterium]